MSMTSLPLAIHSQLFQIHLRTIGQSFGLMHIWEWADWNLLSIKAWVARFIHKRRRILVRKYLKYLEDTGYVKIRYLTYILWKIPFLHFYDTHNSSYIMGSHFNMVQSHEAEGHVRNSGELIPHNWPCLCAFILCSMESHSWHVCVNGTI